MPQRLLLCDDEIHILKAAEIKLTRAGYEVETASDGLEALKCIERQMPDMVITDCQMPRLDGLGLIQRLRENEATRDLPVVMLSAKRFELSEEELTQKWNVAKLLAKPFSPRELAQLVADTLSKTAAPAGV